jgi:hypothetical protein
MLKKQYGNGLENDEENCRRGNKGTKLKKGYVLSICIHLRAFTLNVKKYML